MSSAATANAPAHNAHLHPFIIKLTDQRAARISLEKERNMARMELIPHWIGLMALEDMRETGSCRVSSGTPKAQPEPGAVVYAYSSSLKEGEAGEFCGVQATNQDTVSEERERMEG